MDVRTLKRSAAAANRQIQAGRDTLVRLVREASAAGLSEREIAAAIGRSQPEVNRLRRFNGSSVNGRKLRKARGKVMEILKAAGASKPRVFGSTARGEDAAGSDIDLVVSAQKPLGFMAQAKLQEKLEQATGAKIDLVLESSLRPDLKETILKEAIPL